MSSGHDHHRTPLSPSSSSSSPAPPPFDRVVDVLRLKEDDPHKGIHRLNDVPTKTPPQVTVRLSAVTHQWRLQSPVVVGRGSVVDARRTPDWIPPRGSVTDGSTTVHSTGAHFFTRRRGPPTQRLQVHEGVTPGGGGGRKTSQLGAAERDGVAADTDERTSTRASSSSAAALGMNIGLIVGISSAVLLLVVVLAYAVFKYLRSGEGSEGSYKLDGTDKYCFEGYSESKTVTTSAATPRTMTMTTAANTPTMTTKTKTKTKKQIKEWYV